MLKYLVTVLAIVSVVVFAQDAVYRPGQIFTVSSDALPGTCTVGSIYIKTTEQATLSVCGVANTWADFSGPTFTSVGGASPVAVTLKPGAATGTNTAGASLSLEAGIGTGNATPSSIAVKIPIAGASGTDAQSQVTKALYYNKSYSMPDNTAVNLMTVSLPTDDTGCATHTSFTYTVTNGTSTASHSGIVIWTIVNQNGTVTVMGADAGESVIGTGCGASCDTWNASVASTTATLRGTFDNSLSSTGSLSFQVLNNSCTALTPL